MYKTITDGSFSRRVSENSDSKNCYLDSFHGPSTIQPEKLKAVLRLCSTLEPAGLSCRMPLGPLVKKNWRVSVLLAHESLEISENNFPTDQWIFPAQAHLKDLQQIPFHLKVKHTFKNWLQQPDGNEKMLCRGDLVKMYTQFQQLNSKNMLPHCTGVRAEHGDLVSRGGFYTPLHYDMQGKTRAHCIITPGALKIWVIANSKVEHSRALMAKYVASTQSDKIPVCHNNEIDWLLEHSEYFDWILQQPGQPIEHHGSYFHCVITLVTTDKQVNPHGWCVSTGVAYISVDGVVNELTNAHYTATPVFLQDGDFAVPAGEGSLIKAVSRTVGVRPERIENVLKKKKKSTKKGLKTKRLDKTAKTAKIEKLLQYRHKKTCALVV